ncbi:MAG: tetratricopeptide repeat protein [Acidobacteriota bacterium]
MSRLDAVNSERSGTVSASERSAAPAVERSAPADAPARPACSNPLMRLDVSQGSVPLLLLLTLVVGPATTAFGQDSCPEARQALAAGDYARVVELLAPRVEAVAGDLACLGALGQAQFALGSYPDAAVVYSRALKLAPQHAGLHFNHGLALLKESQLVLGAYMLEHETAGRALVAFERASGLEPDNAFYRHHVGMTLELKGQDERALVEYDRALKLDPLHPESLRQRGVLLLRAGDLTGAINALQSAVQIRPADAKAVYHLGKALLANDDVEKALPVLREAVRLDGASREAHYQLSRVLLLLGKDDEAEQVRERFESLGTTELDSAGQEVAAMAGDGAARRDPRYHLAVAQQAESKRDFAGALAAYWEALELDPTIPDLHRRAALMAARTRDFALAEELFREATRRDPQSYYAHQNLAHLLGMLGRHEEAEVMRAAAREIGKPTGNSP